MGSTWSLKMCNFTNEIFSSKLMYLFIYLLTYVYFVTIVIRFLTGHFLDQFGIVNFTLHMELKIK